MPRPKKPGAPEPKRRSRNGCWNCKAKKVKCGEEKPACLNCQRQDESCDYSIRLNWDRGGRGKRKASEEPPRSAPFMQSTFSVQIQTPNQPTSPSRPSTGNSSSTLLDPSFTLAQLPNFARDFTPGAASSHTPAAYGSPSPSGGTQSPDPSSQQPFSTAPAFSAAMLPPFQHGLNTFRHTSADPDSVGPTEDTPNKRLRFSPHSDGLQPRFNTVDYSSPGPGHSSNPASVTSHPHPQKRSPDPTSGTFSSLLQTSVASLPTPAASATSDDAFAMPVPKRPMLPYGDDDMRRMSVNSLLNAEEEAARDNPFKRIETRKVGFGIDRGLPDYDYPNNLDAQALSPVTPTSPTSHKSFPGVEDDDANEFGFGLHGMGLLADEDKTGVEVAIPESLLPLPSRLTSNPMNLLYFNHFVNHVARILVPHDCSQNPFRSILPQMAVRDDNLLCLLLAYSASHRARLLGYKEPSTRIAMWVENVFPSLRHALNDPETKISNTTIATAIMLASREIIAPGSFGLDISWQSHLDLARRIIAERGGPRSTASGNKDRVSYFLIRWFAYLDIISTLMSGREAARYRRPSEDLSLQRSGENVSPDNSADESSQDQTLSLYTPAYFAPDESSFRIDCLLGFTTRLVSLLARVARLCRRCDNSLNRYDRTGMHHNPAWRPDERTRQSAVKLRKDILNAKHGFFEGCPDFDVSSSVSDFDGVVSEKAQDAAELRSANQAFHAAALVHLDTRVLGTAQGSEEVQNSVKEIVEVLRSLRKGGTAETALLFPMFTAGVEVLDGKDRQLLLDRVKGVEGSGMVQVSKARRLMERVWITGQAWETLVQGEFFG